MVKCLDADLDLVFQALADPHRRRFVLELRQGDKSAGELGQGEDISLVAVMKHIAVLEGAGLIRTEKRGRVRVCTFQPERLRLAEDWLAETRSFWTNALIQLKEHLESDPS
jgi:DNA-binding transcriptional ArsR family regulator